MKSCRFYLGQNLWTERCQNKVLIASLFGTNEQSSVSLWGEDSADSRPRRTSDWRQEELVSPDSPALLGPSAAEGNIPRLVTLCCPPPSVVAYEIKV